ncbi:hypothetical protein [Cohnella massiliensis]|nr:hypothetical protein [Cohnella massiliensis]
MAAAKKLSLLLSTARNAAIMQDFPVAAEGARDQDAKMQIFLKLPAEAR